MAATNIGASSKKRRPKASKIKLEIIDLPKKKRIFLENFTSSCVVKAIASLWIITLHPPSIITEITAPADVAVIKYPKFSLESERAKNTEMKKEVAAVNKKPMYCKAIFTVSFL